MLTLWFKLLCDAPEKWQVTIQDPASPALEGMITFHEDLLFMLFQVGVFVCWFLWNNNRKPQSEKFTHESLIEILWTFSPAIILLFIAVPSFILLYSLRTGSNCRHKDLKSFTLTKFRFLKKKIFFFF